jgi:hypothetical protein
MARPEDAERTLTWSGGAFMSPTISETAEAFSRHRFEETYPFMLDEAEWTLVGGEQVRGKADIMKACQETAGELVNVKASFSRFQGHRGGRLCGDRQPS